MVATTVTVVGIKSHGGCYETSSRVDYPQSQGRRCDDVSISGAGQRDQTTAREKHFFVSSYPVGMVIETAPAVDIRVSPRRENAAEPRSR